MTSNKEAPDSWEEDPVQSATSAMSGLQLRPNAPTFVPGKNIFATSFVPGGAPASQLSPPPPPPEEGKPYYSGPAPTAGEPGDAPTVDTAEAWDANLPSTQRPPEVCPIRQPAAASTTLPEEPFTTKAETPSTKAEPTATKPEPAKSESESEEDENDENDAIVGAVQVSKKKKVTVTLKATLKKEHVNIVFIGHVDAGKSTIGGRVLQATGMVDQRTLEKYEKEAKEKNRETWYLSWALDTNNEERDKGKTVEVGRAYFETETRHFTILDAPGHRSFVPNMIGGASQADIAVLVISARKGEFETGFERGGQTQEHAMLVKTAGVKQLIILINKMDDPTVLWEEERYNECRDKLLPYLKKLGYNPSTDIKVIPCSGLTGAFIKDPPPNASNIAPWYTGETFLDYLDSLPSVTRASEGPVRIPIVDKYRDMGTIALGKVESGQVSVGQRLTVMPNKKDVEIVSIWSDEMETAVANAGENVKLKLKGFKEDVREEDVLSGFVICSPSNLCSVARVFDAQIVILEHKSIICAGYGAVLHFHTGAEEVLLKTLIALVDRKGKKTPFPRFIKQDQIAIVRLELTAGIICLETYKDFPQMGRFTLRDEGRTIAIGKVLKILP